MSTHVSQAVHTTVRTSESWETFADAAVQGLAAPMLAAVASLWPGGYLASSTGDLELGDQEKALSSREQDLAAFLAAVVVLVDARQLRLPAALAGRPREPQDVSGLPRQRNASKQIALQVPLDKYLLREISRSQNQAGFGERRASFTSWLFQDATNDIEKGFVLQLVEVIPRYKCIRMT